MLRPGGRLIAIGYYGRDDVAQLLEPEVVAAAMEATQRRTGWWLRNGFKIKVVHARVDLSDPELAHELLPRLYGDRGRAYLMGPHRPSLRLNLGLYHRGTGRGRRLRIGGRILRPVTKSVHKQPCGCGSGWISSVGPKARLFSPRSLAFGVPRTSGSDERRCDNGRPHLEPLPARAHEGREPTPQRRRRTTHRWPPRRA